MWASPTPPPGSTWTGTCCPSPSPYRRFRELEEKSDGSFLTQSTWQSLLRQG